MPEVFCILLRGSIPEISSKNFTTYEYMKSKSIEFEHLLVIPLKC